MGECSLKLKTGKKHLICIVKSYSLREVEKFEFLANIHICIYNIVYIYP